MVSLRLLCLCCPLCREVRDACPRGSGPFPRLFRPPSGLMAVLPGSAIRGKEHPLPGLQCQLVGKPLYLVNKEASQESFEKVPQQHVKLRKRLSRPLCQLRRAGPGSVHQLPYGLVSRSQVKSRSFSNVKIMTTLPPLGSP